MLQPHFPLLLPLSAAGTTLLSLDHAVLAGRAGKRVGRRTGDAFDQGLARLQRGRAVVVAGGRRVRLRVGVGVSIAGQEMGLVLVAGEQLRGHVAHVEAEAMAARRETRRAVMALACIVTGLMWLLDGGFEC